MSQATAKKAAQKAAKAVSAAYRSSLAGGNYGDAIAAKALAQAMASPYGSIAESMLMPYGKPRRKLTSAEKAARKRVLSAHKSSAARAARLPSKKRGGKKRAKLSKTEKAARARVLKAQKSYASAASKAARLKSKKRSKVAARRASPPSAPKKPAARKNGVKNVTADSVIKGAAQAALKRWACEGIRRSGCGAGGSRVVNHPKGLSSLVRIRPPKFMKA